jgi:hypothetical protein
MKQLIALALFCLLITRPVTAAVHTVDNSPGSTADFVDLQTAIDSAGVGDTLYILGSGINYGNATIESALTLVGEGWCEPATATRVAHLWIRSSSVHLFGIEILELLLDAPNAIGDSLEHVLVERCEIQDYNTGTLASLIFIGLNGSEHAYLHDITFRNNHIWRTPVYGWGNDCLASNFIIDTLRFENNIWDQPAFFFRSGAQGLETLILDHNQFSGFYPYPGGMFYTECFGAPFSVPGATIRNNVLDSVNASGGIGCQYYSNLSFRDATYPAVPDTPGPNISGDPQYMNFPGGDFMPAYDYHFMSGSQGIGAASDGTDIGIYGGQYPWPDCVFDFWDCPDQQANFGDPCLDDGDPDTQNGIGPDCTCDTLNMAVTDHLPGTYQVSVLPNPASERVRVQWTNGQPGSAITLLVTDGLGKVVQSHSAISGNVAVLDVSRLPAGAYFVKLVGKGGQTYGRFIKE